MERLNFTRNRSLDIAKGILILLMVIGHSGAPEWLVNMIYTFHMPCFFIISGFLFSEKYLSSIKHFCIKRIKSLWWPYVKWTWIFLLLHNVLYSVEIYTDAYSLEDIIRRFFTSSLLLHSEQLLGGFWFLTALFIAALFSVCYFKIFGIKIRAIITGIVSLVIISEILCIYNLHIYYINKINLLACAYFMVGTLFKYLKINELKYKNLLNFLSIILLSLSFFNDKLEILNLNHINLIPYFIQSVILSLSFLILMENCQEKKWIKFFCYLGNKTLDILILHFLAFKLVTIIKIKLFNLDYSHMSDFPVIMDYNDYFWIIYVVFTLSVCLIYSKCKDYLVFYLNKIINYLKLNYKNFIITRN